MLVLMRITADIAACMFYTGIDPFTKEAMYLAQKRRCRSGAECRRAGPGWSEFFSLFCP